MDFPTFFVPPSTISRVRERHDRRFKLIGALRTVRLVLVWDGALRELCNNPKVR